MVPNQFKVKKINNILTLVLILTNFNLYKKIRLTGSVLPPTHRHGDKRSVTVGKISCKNILICKSDLKCK